VGRHQGVARNSVSQLFNTLDAAGDDRVRIERARDAAQHFRGKRLNGDVLSLDQRESWSDRYVMHLQFRARGGKCHGSDEQGNGSNPAAHKC
jgi:hypothetical protein